MGFFKSFTRVIKKVTKPITKIVKKTVKKVAKIGKAVMKGVAKISNKLGPVGMIALSIAMPYALGGLSSLVGTYGGTTGLMNSSNLFLKSIGTIGNQIRTGYKAFNTFASTAKQGISNTISKAFSKLAPKGTGNFFSNISQGAKNLYNAGKNKLKSVMPKPFTAAEGTVQVGDMGYGFGETTSMTSSQAVKALDLGQISGDQLSKQTLSGNGGWFTKTNSSGITSDRLVTETINDAYKARLDGFGENAKRMFNDIRNKAMEMDTYINDEQIGSFVEDNVATKSYTNEIMEYAGDMDYTGGRKFQIKTEIPDLAQTGDYKIGTTLPGQSNQYTFTGGETFGKQEATQGFLATNKKKLMNLGKSLLKPSGTPELAEAPLSIPEAPLQASNFNSLYSGTDIRGSGGGNLVAAVYGDAAANNIKNYYKNMNLLNSGESYLT